jgi:capsular exopolysaccharide synthesis family protein
LIEADLRRPSIAAMLGLVADVGFTTVVIGKAPVETVLQNAGRNLAVLTSGPVPPNPSELLLSQHAKQVIFDIAAKVDFTIIDTPPLLPVADGAELATVAHGMILVHRAGKTTRDQALRAMEALDKVGKKPIGVVLNMVTRQGGKYDYEYGYSYTAYRPNVAKASKNADSISHEPPVGDVYQPESSLGEAARAMATATRAADQQPPTRGRRRRGKGAVETPAVPGTTAAGRPVQKGFAPPPPPTQSPLLPPLAPPTTENGYEVDRDETARSPLLPPQPTPTWFRPNDQ